MSEVIEKSPDATVHIPILLKPIVECLIDGLESRLSPTQPEKSYIVDCTLGGGGHTRAFLNALMEREQLRDRVVVLGVDQDEEALSRARLRFASEIKDGRLELHHGRFSELKPLLETRFCFGLLADFGFSSDQVDNPARGLSFRSEGPLDMRLDPSRGESARSWLLKAREQEIEAVLREYGEERYSKRIASAIVEARREKVLPSTTREFADFITRLMPPQNRYGRIHPATRVFQAIRIQVNDELGEIDRLLSDILPLLRPKAHFALMSFHSLEDRRVKWAIKENEELYKALTKKPVEADDEEVARNPRSRSAKLRIGERIESKGS